MSRNFTGSRIRQFLPRRLFVRELVGLIKLLLRYTSPTTRISKPQRLPRTVFPLLLAKKFLNHDGLRLAFFKVLRRTLCSAYPSLPLSFLHYLFPPPLCLSPSSSSAKTPCCPRVSSQLFSSPLHQFKLLLSSALLPSSSVPKIKPLPASTNMHTPT